MQRSYYDGMETLHLRRFAYELAKRKRYKEAYEIYSKLSEDVSFELSQIAIGLASQGDWSVRDEITNTIKHSKSLIDPGSLLNIIDDPQLHFNMAKTNATYFRAEPLKLLKNNNEKIRIGYVSSNFNNHPMSYLMDGIIRSHKFETFGYDIGYDDNSNIRRNIKENFDFFFEVKNMKSIEIAKKIAADKIDVLIDLNGYTPGSRPEIFSYKPAPYQISYLGYCGTLCSNIEYILADDVVISDTTFYSEKKLSMSCYYPGGNYRKSVGIKRTIGLVYGCFADPLKISPEMFSAWMQIIERTGGKLCLLDSGREMKQNLSNEAKKYGMEKCIFFLPRMEMDKHIFRHADIDVFLDTFPFGSHTTGCDVIWADRPLVTYCGKSFASRVAASILTKIDVPELITRSIPEYIEMAVSLADAHKRSHISNKIIQQKHGLFDNQKFVENFESIIINICQKG